MKKPPSAHPKAEVIGDPRRSRTVRKYLQNRKPKPVLPMQRPGSDEVKTHAGQHAEVVPVQSAPQTQPELVEPVLPPMTLCGGLVAVYRVGAPALEPERESKSSSNSTGAGTK